MNALARTCAVFTLAIVPAVSSCDDTVFAEGAFIFISNTWEDVDSTVGHRFSLQSTDDGERSGEFTGTEFVDFNDFDGFPLTGSWDLGHLSFTVIRPSGSVTYSAQLTEDGLDELFLTSPAGSLHLVRQQQ